VTLKVADLNSSSNHRISCWLKRLDISWQPWRELFWLEWQYQFTRWPNAEAYWLLQGK